jgi:hypothetical protein
MGQEQPAHGEPTRTLDGRAAVTDHRNTCVTLGM